jgi:hypothetical protein
MASHWRSSPCCPRSVTSESRPGRPHSSIRAGAWTCGRSAVRISAELVSASNGFRLWAQTYERRLENIFTIQTEIAEAITEAPPRSTWRHTTCT